ncbi:MAG: Ldh family oxidoreductase [Bryobacterales bacterium]|nr:Ldh family oxidoreductase [Bryobacterales bacterium]
MTEDSKGASGAPSRPAGMAQRVVASLSAALRQVREHHRVSGPLWTASLLVDRVVPGAPGLWPDRMIAAPVLSAQVEVILRAWGMSEEHIAITTRHLIYADLHGIDSHGCAMLFSYHRNLAAGNLNMRPEVRVVRESGTTAVVDGGGGLGHVAAEMAMELAIRKCQATGMGSVAVRNSGHFGAAGAYAAMAVESGLLGIVTSNTAEPAIVPTFGLEARLGTNPLCFAAPALRNKPFLLDMATSTAPLGKLVLAWRRGKSIPTGWAQDRRGRPVTNARRAWGLRRLTPLGSTREMGGHKGYGLAGMVEILSSVLPGVRAHQAGDIPRVGHFFLALDPARFRDQGDFESDLDGMIDTLRACPPADPREPVMVAGDPEYAVCATRAISGIPLSRSTVEDIRTVCDSHGVEFLLDRST